jgi:plastocyanin
MFRTRSILSTCAVALSAMSAPVMAQAPATGPHLITIKLVERPGDKLPFAFEPATFTAQRGDTLKFVQAANTIHNVHFKKVPPGAKLGSAMSSPYLSTKGQSITLVVDGRFTPGSYEIVCDPHETIGMHAFLTVGTTR